MNLFKKSLASKTKQLNEAKSLDVERADDFLRSSLEELSQAIKTLFQYADRPTTPKAAKDVANNLANELSLTYDDLMRKVDKTIPKLV